MPEVLIKSDIHTSEGEKQRFEELTENFDSALQEKRPERSSEDKGLGARIVQRCWDDYTEKLADFIQRDSDQDPGIDSLDLSLAEMYSSLGQLRKFAVYAISVSWILMSFLSVLVSIVQPSFLFWAVPFLLMVPVVHVMNVVLLSTGARERKMTETIEKELSKDDVDDVVVFVGAAHALPVRERLEEQGVDAEIEGVKGVAKLIVLPVNYLRGLTWRLRRLFH